MKPNLAELDRAIKGEPDVKQEEGVVKQEEGSVIGVTSGVGEGGGTYLTPRCTMET